MPYRVQKGGEEEEEGQEEDKEESREEEDDKDKLVALIRSVHLGNILLTRHEFVEKALQYIDYACRVVWHWRVCQALALQEGKQNGSSGRTTASIPPL